MPAIINPVITDAGLAAAIHAAENQLQLVLTHISLGTGKYDAQATGVGMTAMAARKETVPIPPGSVSGTGAFKMAIRFNSWEAAPYDATELGFWAGDPDAGGVLFAVYSHVSNVLVQRNSLDYVTSFVLQLTRVPAGSVTIVIDTDAAQTLGLIADHEAKPNPHPQYVKRAGDTMDGPLNLVTPAQHDASKKAINAEWAQRLGISFPSNGGLALADAAPVLTLADVGRWVDIQTNGAQVKLPKASTAKIGATFQIAVSVANAVLVPTDDDVFVYPGGSSSVYPVVFGESITITRNATKEWRIINVGFRMPAGMVAYFAGNVAPAGWLKLSGVTLPRAAYPALWAYAQSTGGIVSDTDWWNNNMSGRFSSGVAGNDFRIPDVRGVFLRALDDGRGLDVGRAFGTYQDHANRAHAHGLSDPGHVHTLNDPGHAHSVYDPGHIHAGSTDVQGEHRHENEVGDGFAQTGSAGVGNNGTAQGLPKGGAGFGVAWSNTPWTRVAGAHGHNVTVGLNGTGIGIYPAGTGLSMNPKTSGIAVQSEGSEARPRNVAFSLFIKY